MSPEISDQHVYTEIVGSGPLQASTTVASDTGSQFGQPLHKKDSLNVSSILLATEQRGEDTAGVISPEIGDSRIFGLGIYGSPRPVPIHRVPVGSKDVSPTTNAIRFASATNTPQTPVSGQPLLSPVWQSQERGRWKDSGRIRRSRYNSPIEQRNNTRRQSEQDDHQPYIADDDMTPLRVGASHSLDNRSPNGGCASARNIHTAPWTGLPVTILLLSVYSTAMSALWLTAAFVQPRWGRAIQSNGALSPSTASLLSAFVAKTIELSFVTVFVAFIGQVLSRRSLVKASRGITLAEMSMRTWIIQPGSLLMRGETLRYAGLTILGVISLVATIVALLYTTASDALVSPKLQFGGWENRQMQGLVKSSYANPEFVKAQCKTPISSGIDPYSGETCLSIEHAANAYHNYKSWINTWADINLDGRGASTRMTERPQGVALLFDNTTVTGNWISESNITANFEKFKRIVNNVTMAMPHPGVFFAAREERNSIIQPGDLEGSGEYNVRASVVSPSVNVLCSNVAHAELANLTYTSWPNARTSDSDNSLAWSGWEAEVPKIGYINATVVDDVFQWGEKYNRRPPVFPNFPMDHNTVLNTQQDHFDSVYVVFKSDSIANYTLCSLRSFLSTNCSTHYNVTGLTAGTLEAHCEDKLDHLAYGVSVTDVPPLEFNSDWTNVARVWAYALALNDGAFNANASNARLLSQLVVVEPLWGSLALPTLKPSIAEALAVLCGSTLLTSSTWASFLHFWSYPGNILTPGEYQIFNASIQSQQYTSGHNQGWQGVFFAPLILVFAINVLCLIYHIAHSGLVTDYTEPQNLFALAVNSPPSEGLAGSCGAGPTGRMLGIKWSIKMEEDSMHYYIEEQPLQGAKRSSGNEIQPVYSPEQWSGGRVSQMSTYTKLSSKRRSYL